jgi:hypothetical protein
MTSRTAYAEASLEVFSVEPHGRTATHEASQDGHTDKVVWSGDELYAVSAPYGHH